MEECQITEGAYWNGCDIFRNSPNDFETWNDIAKQLFFLRLYFLYKIIDILYAASNRCER